MQLRSWMPEISKKRHNILLPQGTLNGPKLPGPLSRDPHVGNKATTGWGPREVSRG